MILDAGNRVAPHGHQPLRVVVLLTLAIAASACAGPRAGGTGTDVGPGAESVPGTDGRPQATAADVAFMRGMIEHHRQALEMAALVPSRTSTASIHLLAERIQVSQTDEIALMSRWLESQGASVPDPAEHAGHADHGMAMPGMLTAQQMAALAAAQGAAFDRLFLESMIQHHRGALVMVGQLLATPGAGQDVDVYRIASEVDSDQRIEIDRMQQMLASLG